MDTILNIEGLYKHFDGIVAVDNVSLSIKQGTVTGIYGENGAGKTTLFNIISGFEKPDQKKIIISRRSYAFKRVIVRFRTCKILYIRNFLAYTYYLIDTIKGHYKDILLKEQYKGKISFKKIVITHKSLLQISRLGVGRLFQTPRFFADVTVFDNLLSSGNSHEANYLHYYLLKHATIKKNYKQDSEKANIILKQLHLTEKSNHKAFELSVGERKLLSLGCLLMNDAKLILLDEPFAGLSEKMIEELKYIFLHLKQQGVTLIIIEHKTEFLESLCDAIIEMRQGKIL